MRDTKGLLLMSRLLASRRRLCVTKARFSQKRRFLCNIDSLNHVLFAEFGRGHPLMFSEKLAKCRLVAET